MKDHDVSKRSFLKTTAYVAPAILTLAAVPSFAASGSGSYPRKNEVASGSDPYPVTPKSESGSGLSGAGSGETLPVKKSRTRLNKLRLKMRKAKIRRAKIRRAKIRKLRRAKKQLA
ncbi:MAG: hypothetical protein M3436_12420 [Pseudomonadota bacterium]|nr:hypothetical protein [Pseudomonadota bacterium]